MRKSRPVQVKHVQIGGGAPVAIQSMTKTDTADVGATVAQIEEMVSAGCEIVRLAVPDNDAAIALKEIRKRVPEVPIVADIHFHYKLALMALEAGIDKLRLNPGNIGKHERIVEVVRAAQVQKVPIRIGVNGGSLEKDLLKKYGTATPEAMVESAMRHIKILEDLDFTDIVISLKASDVHRTVAAYRLLAAKVDYPFHLGVTEAGTAFTGTVKSSIGLGILLHEGIGDTIRVSLTPRPGGDRREEVYAACEILQSLGLRSYSPSVTACPGCGRTTSSTFQELAERVQGYIREQMPAWKTKYEGVESLTLAVMGCVVNGPGESKAANIGISLPGTGEAPNCPVFIDGEHATTLRGTYDELAAAFQKLVDDYIERKYDKKAVLSSHS